jgi:hypothetical protein
MDLQLCRFDESATRNGNNRSLQLQISHRSGQRAMHAARRRRTAQRAVPLQCNCR